MLVGLQITPRLCCKTNYWTYNTDNNSLRENLNKLCFIKMSKKLLLMALAM